MTAPAALTTAAIAAARPTTPRTPPGRPFPTSMATSRTAAMSIPNRVPAPATNASWVASVTRPSAVPPAGANAREMRTFAPKLART